MVVVSVPVLVVLGRDMGGGMSGSSSCFAFGYLVHGNRVSRDPMEDLVLGHVLKSFKQEHRSSNGGRGGAFLVWWSCLPLPSLFQPPSLSHDLTVVIHCHHFPCLRNKLCNALNEGRQR